MSNKIIEIKAPAFPESIVEGTLAAWSIGEGEFIARDALLVEIETDKVVLEVPAPVNGILKEILVQEGDIVESGQLIAKLEEAEAGAQTSESKASETTSAPSANKGEEANNSADAQVIANPAAIKLAGEKSVNLAEVKGSGKDGRVLKEDVENFVANQAKTTATTSQPKAASVSAIQDLAIPAGERIEKRVPMSRIRQTIAKRLVEAQQTAAMLTTYNEVDMKPAMDLRANYKDLFEKKHGVRLGFMSLFVKAATEALKRFPDVNASIDGTELVYHGYQDIGVAVSTPRGLVVPVLRDTDAMSLADIEKTIADFGARGKEGKLGIDEMQGGTFTITNGGVFGSLMSTPILNPPQTAILGMHKIEKRPVVVNDQIVIRPMMYLALSYDHRMIDGKDAVQFLVAIKEMLEDPARILLEV